MRDQYAREIYQEYYSQGQTLVNTFCQIKNVRPLEPLPKLSREIWKVQTLAWFWANVAKVLR